MEKEEKEWVERWKRILPVKEGWIYCREFPNDNNKNNNNINNNNKKVSSIWQKRWQTLSHSKLISYSEKGGEVISVLSLARIQEIQYFHSKKEVWTFSVNTVRGIIKFASPSQQEREEWVEMIKREVSTLRWELVNEIRIQTRKIKLQKRREIQNKEAIESIHSTINKLSVKRFNEYADQLAYSLQELLNLIDIVTKGCTSLLNSPDIAMSCAKEISKLVEASNLTALACSNNKNENIQNDILSITQEIAQETANLLAFAFSNSRAQNDLSSISLRTFIYEKVQNLLQILLRARED